MKNNIHAHVPYGRLAEHLEYAIANDINPEVFFSADALDRLIPEELSALADSLRNSGLHTTIHAPFLDLNPGAVDTGIRAVSRQRIRQVLQTAEILRPKVIVVHPGYDDLHYGDNRMIWLKNSIDFWQEFVPLVRELGTILAVENIYEKEPSTIKALLDAVSDPCFRHCFDVGHWHLFTTVTLEEWFRELGEYVVECHIHDNHGQLDEHLPVGEGAIPFEQFFPLLLQYAPTAVRTIEAHSTEHLQRALKNIRNYIPRGDF
ncbi:MAG: sugar phosphate isomerase/epimerase [Desulfuromonadaceae bacterium]|nr:sugar phosphate isomerase/epimerase [Desulfuromonadaceae bacterium]MDD5106356.1 sugar phosphate isomerase/epimerase [Desulfuromonadaceae bacterium]